MERKYLPTLSELIDRLSIVQLKSIFIKENSEEYNKEIELILHDIDLILENSDNKINSNFIRSAMIIMLTNRYIWENESKARQGGAEQDKLLKLTHSINGVRNLAKNIISQEMGERVDLKIDCLAEELLQEFGNWNIYKNN